MAYIRFEPNIPVEIALKFDGGKQVQSKIANAPDQMMFTLCGDDIIFVSLEVAKKIADLGIRKFEPFRITKQVKGKATTWLVERVSDAAEPSRGAVDRALDAAVVPAAKALASDNFNAIPSQLERDLEASVEQVKQQRANPGKVTPAAAGPGPVLVNGKISEQANPTADDRGQTVESRRLASALIAAIDAVRVAADYAAAKGIDVSFDLEFNAEDIRALASTAYIQACRSSAYVGDQTAGAFGGRR